jgi:SOS response regulatory protein OraA/RecX
MTSQRETDLRKGLVRELCTQLNRVFRLELCVTRHLMQKGISKEEIRAALNETRLGNLDPLTALLEPQP